MEAVRCCASGASRPNRDLYHKLSVTLQSIEGAVVTSGDLPDGTYLPGLCEPLDLFLAPGWRRHGGEHDPDPMLQTFTVGHAAVRHKEQESSEDKEFVRRDAMRRRGPSGSRSGRR